MPRCATGCRLLLITPALFILLQVALTLHHHHFQSYHDAKDSFHAASTECCSDHLDQSVLGCLVSSEQITFPSCFGISSPDNSSALIADLVISPSHSRAPPLTVHS